MTRYYRLDGDAIEECSEREWATFFDHGERVLLRSVIQGRVRDTRVTTVFTGLDEGDGLIATTTVLAPVGMPGHGHVRRYATIEAARAGHWAIVDEISPRGTVTT